MHRRKLERRSQLPLATATARGQLPRSLLAPILSNLNYKLSSQQSFATALSPGSFFVTPLDHTRS